MVFKRYILLFLIGSVLNSYAAIGMVEDLRHGEDKDNVALTKIRELNTKDVSSFIENHNLLFIYSDNCRHCHEMSPVVKNFVDRFSLDFGSAVIDGRMSPHLSQQFVDLGVFGIPALIFFNNDSKKPVGKSVGVKSEDELIDWLRGLVEIYRLRNIAKNISPHGVTKELLAEMTRTSEGDEGNV